MAKVQEFGPLAQRPVLELATVDFFRYVLLSGLILDNPDFSEAALADSLDLFVRVTIHTVFGYVWGGQFAIF